MTATPPHLPPPQATTLPYASYDVQRQSDDTQLNVLRILHFVWGGLSAVLSCLFLFHIFMGIAMVSGAFDPAVAPGGGPTTAAATPMAAQQAVPRWLGWMFIALGSMALLLGWATAVANIISGRAIGRRKWRVFSIVVAAVNCLAMPLGTALGVFTLVVLLRGSVTAQYEEAAAADRNARPAPGA